MDVLPPDPYKALGLTRDATSAAIKTAYRKAALKCHPDKVEGKGDDFFKIQQAYEILGDDSRRQQYDDETRLAELRKDVFGKRNGGSMPNVEIRTASFEVRSSSNSMGTGFTARGPTRMAEERRHSASKTPYEDPDDYFVPRNNSRKYDGRPPPRPSRSGETPADIKLEKTNSKERERMEREKLRKREQKQDRGSKYAFVNEEDDESSNSDEKNRQELPRRRHDENERPQYPRPRTEPRSSDENLNTYEKWQTLESDVMNYIKRSKQQEATAAPHIERASPPPPSSYPRGQDPYEARKGIYTEPRPAMHRRNSTTRHKEKPNVAEPPPRLSRRDSVSRRSPDQDLPNHTASVRRPPTLASTQSSPSTIKIPPPVDEPRRTRTEYPERPAPHARIQRAETMPTKPSSSSRPAPPRARESTTTPVIGSNLRHAAEINDSGYSTSSPSEATQPLFSQPPAPPTSFKQPTKYFYGDHPPVVEEPLSNGPVDYGTATRPATIFREPSKTRHHSPSPPQERHERTSAKNPPLSRSASHMHHTSSDRATSRERSKTTTTGNIRQRPGIQRSDSSRVATRGPPPRSAAPLAPLKTPGPAAGPYATGLNGAIPQYIDESLNVRSASPLDYGRLASETVRPSRKSALPPRDDNGYGPDSAPWDEEFGAFPAAQKIAPGRRSYTIDTPGGVGRSGTVREMRGERGERDALRDRERERDRDRDRERDSPRERDRERDRVPEREREREKERERERERERDRAYGRERPRAQARRSATMEAY